MLSGQPRALWASLLVALLLALLLRGLYWLEMRDVPTFRHPVMDAEQYDREAREIAAFPRPCWRPSGGSSLERYPMRCH